MKLVKACELELGDVVSLFPDDAFSTAIVRNIKDGLIYLYRPYAITANFTYTGGVIPYVGIEDFTIPVDTVKLVTLYRKTPLK